MKAKMCKGGGAVRFGGLVQTPGNIPDTNKLHISACREHYNLGQHVFVCNSHTVCRTFKNQAKQHCPLVEETWKVNSKVKTFQLLFRHLAIKVPSIGRFPPNSAQSLIGPWNTITKSVVVIGLRLVKICKTVSFEHNVQEFILSYFERVLDYHNSFDMFLSGESKDA